MDKESLEVEKSSGSTLPSRAKVAVTLWMFFSLIYVLKNPISKYALIYTGSCAIVIYVTVLAMPVDIFRLAKPTAKRYYDLIASFVIGALASAQLGVMAYVLLIPFADIFLWAFSSVTFKTTSAIAISILTLVSGCLLFFYRHRCRCVYGVAEVMAGLFIAGYKFFETEATKALTDPNFYLVMLTAGVYLVVRGLDNVHQGIDRDPIAQAFIRRTQEVSNRLSRWGANFANKKR